jgi:radical SAM protein with 4Fe4S-binding SPASM domain
MENQTITTNIERKRRLIDESVQLLPDGMPLFHWVEISPADSCNRQCTFCPRADKRQFPNRALTMHPALYQRMAAELGALNYGGIVILSGYGEPMLSKQIYGMVEAFSPVARVELVTDGDYLTVHTAAKLYAAGLSMFLVSLYDGPEQAQYFERIFLAAEVPRECYVLRDRWYGADKDFGVKLTNRVGMVAAGHQPPVARDHLCYYPHYAMMVDWNGDVMLCCQDWNRRVKFGNLAYQGMVEVWSSPSLRAYRTLLARGERASPPCSQCNADGTLHGGGHAEAWERYYSRGVS